MCMHRPRHGPLTRPHPGSEKTPAQLLELLGDVVGAISLKHAVRSRGAANAPPAVAAVRMQTAVRAARCRSHTHTPQPPLALRAAPQRPQGVVAEAPAATLERVLSFVRVVKYKPPTDA